MRNYVWKYSRGKVYRERETMTFLRIFNLLLVGLVAWLALNKWQKRRATYEDRPTIVATVNGKPIFARDLLASARSDGQDPSPAKLRSALARQIRMEVVSEKADRESVETQKIDLLTRTVLHQFSDTEEERAAFSASKMDQSLLRRQLERHLRVEMWLSAAAKSEPTEAECRAWFAAHPEIAEMPEMVQASHFCAIFPPRGTALELLEKNDLIRDAQSRLQEGIPFSQLIDAFSDDPAKKTTCGSLHWFGHQRMEPEIIEAAFKQPIGEFGAPITTRFGHHLLLVSDRTPAVTLTYEEVAGEVRQYCRAEMEQKKIEALVAGLQQRAKIKIFDPQLEL